MIRNVLYEVRKNANIEREKMFDFYMWEKPQAFTDGDVRIILESTINVLSKILNDLCPTKTKKN